MRRERLIPLAVLAALLVAAAGFLAAASLGGSSDDEAAPERRESAERRERWQEFVEELLQDLEPPRLERRQQPFVGLVLGEEGGAVVVEQVLPGSPAARARIHEGDVIEAVGDTSIHSPEELADLVRDSERGDALTFRVRRDGDAHEIDVRVALRPVAIESFRERLRPLLPQEGLLELFERLDLREKLSEGFERFIEGQITFLDDQSERVTLRVIAGAIVEASSESVAVAPNGGGPEQEFTVTDDTHIVRVLHRVHADDVEPGDSVLVLARDEGREALVILAFPGHGQEAEG